MKKIVLLIVSIVSLMSCHKEDQNPAPSNVVMFGNYLNMNVTYYDTVLTGGYQSTLNLDIDINKDNSYDLRLISQIWGSPGLGQNPCSKLWCLNSNIKIAGYYKTDTSFLNRSTSIQSGTNNTVEIYEYYNYTCNRMDETDSILAVLENEFKVSPKDQQELLRFDDTFRSDFITLIDDSYEYPASSEEIGVDTIQYTITSFYNDCNSFPQDQIKYIGFKMLDDNIEKLGWIKLSIADKYKITILETALQK